MELKRIEDICKIQTGKVDVNEGSPMGQYDFFTCAAIPLRSNNFSFEGESILLPGNGANVGLALYYNGKFEAYQRTYVLNQFKAFPKYVFFYFKSFWKNQIANHQYGSATNYIRYDNIADFKIPLPDLKTQQKIAGILEQADAARQKRKQANQLTEQFLQSAFLEMFGDPVRNEKGWEKKRLEDSAKTQIGPFGTQLHEEDYIDNGIPLINPRHIVNGKIKIDFKQSITKEKFETLSNYHLKTGDVIMGRRGEMGRCALVSEKENGWLCGTGSLFIRPEKNLISTYLIFVMSHPAFVKELENSAQGVTMMNLNLTIINNLQIPLPPLPLQKKFSTLVEQVEQLRVKQRESEKELENLFGSLMQRYFG